MRSGVPRVSVRRGLGCLLIVMSAVALASCSAVPEAKSSSGIIAAVTLGPQTYRMNGFRDIGFVVTFDESGSAEVIKMGKGIDTSRATWTEDGLFFADQENQYVLSDEVKKFPCEPSETMLHTAIHVPEPSGVMSVFNVGFSADGYDMHASFTTAHGATSSMLEGYGSLAVCDDQVFMVAKASGEFAQPSDEREAFAENYVAGDVPSPDENPQYVLTRLDFVPQGEAVHVTQSEVAKTKNIPSIFVSDGEMNCVDGTIRHTVERDGPGPDFVGMMSWDTKSGDFELHELQLSNGATPWEELEFGISNFGPALADSDSMRWISSTGVVYEATWDGVTTEIANGLPPVGYGATYDLTTVIDNQIFGVHYDESKSDYVLSGFDLDTFEKTTSIELPDLDNIETDATVLRYLSMKPQH